MLINLQKNIYKKLNAEVIIILISIIVLVSIIVLDLFMYSNILKILLVASIVVLISIVFNNRIIEGILLLSPFMEMIPTINIGSGGIDFINIYMIFTNMILFIFIIHNFKKIYKTKIMKVYLIYFIYLFLNSLFITPKFVWATPTLLRHSGIIMVYIVSYFQLKEGKLKLDKIEKIMIMGSIIPTFLGIYQLLTKSGMDINNANRITGSFGHHPLGYALYLQIIIIFFMYRYYISKNKKHIVYVLINLVLLLGTNTRLVFVTTIIGLILILIRFRDFNKIPILLLIVGTVIIMQGSLLNRLLSTLELDDSTRYRVVLKERMEPYIEESPILGIGVGNFSKINENISGEKRVAPHDDYFGAKAETGYIGLVLYIILQGIIILHLRKSKNGYLGLIIYLCTNILCYLENPNNFYVNQMLLWIIIGFVSDEQKIKEVKYDEDMYGRV